MVGSCAPTRLLLLIAVQCTQFCAVVAQNVASGSDSVVSGGRLNTVTESFSSIGGGVANVVTSYSSAIGGGRWNTVSANFATISGGSGNTVRGVGAVVAGGVSNIALQQYSSVLSGSFNYVNDSWTSIAGGRSNTVTGIYSSVGGGVANVVTSYSSAVGGGRWNTASAHFATVAGGSGNTVHGAASVVAGGMSNVVTSYASAISGGRWNAASGPWATVGGGSGNSVGATGATVAGGVGNVVAAYSSTIGGGRWNAVSSYWGTVAGGSGNSARGIAGAIAGGVGNIVSHNYSAVLGGNFNFVAGSWSSVAGGRYNSVTDTYSFIGGGAANAVVAYSSTVGGGRWNTVGAYFSTVAGGSGNTVHGAGAVVAGGIGNVVTAYASAVGGGRWNSVGGSWSTVAGGSGNSVRGKGSAVAGGVGNAVSAYSSTVGGGLWNSVSSHWGTVAGGSSNSVHGVAAVVAGGVGNVASQNYSAVLGGDSNTVLGSWTAICGGRDNIVTNTYSSVGGGVANVVSSYSSAVGGGRWNTVTAHFSTISGGSGNSVHGAAAVVAGGSGNIAMRASTAILGGTANFVSGFTASIAGGQLNTVTASYSSVGGGDSNLVSSYSSAVCGGRWNTVSAFFATIAGGSGNTVRGAGSVVAGGVSNTAVHNYSAVLGGSFNVVAADSATVSGGERNSVTGKFAGVLGGRHNVVAAPYSCIGGGSWNFATGQHSEIGGGSSNQASGDFASIVGGLDNAASGTASTIAGGLYNVASGSGSLAAGVNASATHHASAVFSFTQGQACASTDESTVTICAANGLFINGKRLDNVTEAVSDNRADVEILAKNATLQQQHVESLQANVRLIENELGDLSQVDDALWLNAIQQQQAWRLLNDTSASLAENISTWQGELRMAESRLTVLEPDVQDMLSLSDDVHGMQSNVTQLGATLDDVRSAVATVNMSLIELESYNVGLLSRNVSQMSRSLLLLEATTSDVRNTAHDTVLDVTALEQVVHNHSHRIGHTEDAIDKVNMSLSDLGAFVAKQVAANVSTLSQSMQNLTASLITVRNTGLHNSDNVSRLSELVSLLNADLLEVRNTGLLNSGNVTALELVAQSHSQQILQCTDTLLDIKHELSDQGEHLNQSHHVDAEMWNNASQQQVLLDAALRRITSLDESTTRFASGVVTNITFQRNNTAKLQQDVLHAYRMHDDLAHIVSGQVVDLNATDLSQQLEIDSLRQLAASQALDIQRLNETASAQQQEINTLGATLATTTHNLTTLASVVQQLLQATTFSPMQDSTHDFTSDDPDCGGPCSTTIEVARPAPMFVSVCYSFPCDGDPVDAWALHRDVVVIGDALGAGDVEQVELSLQTTDGFTVWSSSGSLIASFIPAEVGVRSDVRYVASVRALVDGVWAQNVSAELEFSSPPVLHDVEVQWVNGTASLNSYQVRVNASDVTDLTYEYWLVDTTSDWRYQVAFGGSQVLIDAPSTRSLELQTIVTNAYGSSVACEECPWIYNTSAQTSVEIVSSAKELANKSLAVLISGVDAGGDADEFLQMFVDNTNASAVSLEIVVLWELVEHGASQGALVAFDELNTRINAADSATLAVYAAALDTYASLAIDTENGVDNVQDLDEYLESVCVSEEAGSVPDGTATAFRGESFSLACASTLDDVVVEAGAAQFVTSVDSLSTVTVTAWDTVPNTTTAEAALLSTIHGVHVTSSDGELEETVETVAGHTLALGGVGNVSVLRKSASCQYYDPALARWSQRGVYLRGLSMDNSMRGATVICSTSHLTLFAIGDESASLKVLEDKVSKLVNRVAAINDVDVFAGDAQVNWPILGSLGIITVVFVGIVAFAKHSGRRNAVDAARHVFRKFGVLQRPEVMGSLEYEGLLRRWIVGAHAAKLLVLELMTTNAFLGLFFRWEHEAIVFGTADKAVTFYCAVLMTFLSSAFLFEPNDEASNDVLLVLWSTFLSAVLTNVLLLPVQHVVPYMVSNVNSLTTSTRIPSSMLQKEFARFRGRICCGSRKKPSRQRSRRDIIKARVVLHWLTLMTGTDAATRSNTCTSHEAVPTALKLFRCNLSMVSAAHLLTKAEKLRFAGIKMTPSTLKALITLQWSVKRYLEQRNASRIVEFETWYLKFQRERRTLAWLSAGVVVICGAFTLVVCLLMSGAFSEAETLLWTEDVAKSIALQVFITDPALGLLIVTGKLVINAAILSAARRRKLAHLESRQRSLNADEVETLSDINVVEARSKALELMAAADSSSINEERRKQRLMKANCETTLERIAVTKVSLERSVSDKGHKLSSQRRSAKLALIHKEEASTRRALKPIEAVLRVLDGDRQRQAGELEEARLSLAKLHRKLSHIQRNKKRMRSAREKLQDKPRVKKNAVMPVHTPDTRHPGMADDTDGPETPRAAMPSVLTPSMRSPTQAALARLTSTTAPRITPRRTRRTRRRSGALTVPRTQTATFNLRSAPGRPKPSFRPRRKMTWAEIKELQQKLRAAAASDNTFALRKSRTGMSRKAIKIILERRARRQKLLSESRKQSQQEK